MNWAAVFGIGKLSKADLAIVKKQVAEWFEGLPVPIPSTAKEVEEAIASPFGQGRPNGACPNPQCSNHNKAGKLTPIALMPAEPVTGVHTFGQWGNDTQLIFELCELCHTIRASNQCT